MSDRKSLTLPFFFVITFFLCLRYYLFFCFRLCLCYCLFPLSSLLLFFCVRHSVTNYKVVQNAEVNNQNTVLECIIS